MLNTKRVIYSTLLGFIVGIFCIIGVIGRIGTTGNELLIISLLYNRILLGFIIGLSKDIKIIKGRKNPIIRGAILGIFVGGSFFLSTNLIDPPSFYASIVYGMVIDFIITSYIK